MVRIRGWIRTIHLHNPHIDAVTHFPVNLADTDNHQPYIQKVKGLNFDLDTNLNFNVNLNLNFDLNGVLTGGVGSCA